MKLSLAATPPFDLRSVIASHGWAQLEPFRTDDARTEIGYVLRLASSRIVELTMRQIPDGPASSSGSRDPGVEVRVEPTAGKTDAGRDEISAAVCRMLGLDRDFSEFYAVAREEPKLAHVEERAQGRLLRSPTVFEDAVKTILTTNTTWSGTVGMVRKLVARYGDPLSDDPKRRAFPTPERLAGTDEKTLRGSTGLGYRAPYVIELARDVAAGELDLEALEDPDLPAPELRRRLLAIKGVGDYAAASLMMLLGRYDTVPVDSWARKLVSEEFHDGEPVDRPEIEAAFEDWGDWRGLAFWLWDWSLLRDMRESAE